jgi:hypothetical protein
MGHSWRPIAPLDSDWQEWADTELDAIRVVWSDLQKAIGEQTAAKLHERMLTEWSIETGMVEDLYRWDRGVTETLLAHGVRADRIPDGASSWSPELVAQVIRDQVAAVEGLFAFVKEERPFGTSFIHELHAQLLRSVPHNFDLGKWKVLPNGVELTDGTFHEYCPPEHVAAEIDRLLELNREYATQSVPVEVRAAWIHHRFTQIHPYPDGNGRVARALATLLFVKAQLFPLIIRPNEKHLYFDALEAADRGDDQPLIERFRAMQRREIVKVCDFIPLAPTDAGPSGTLEDTIRRIGQKLDPERIVPDYWSSMPEKVEAIRDEAARHIERLAQQLTQEFAARTGFRFQTVSLIGGSLDLCTEGIDYEFRKAPFNTSVYLQMDVPQPWRIACTVHGTGPKANGLAACIVHLDSPNAQQWAGFGPYFLITYAEPLAHLQSRFSKWLEKQLIKALDLWQQQL